MKWVLPVFMMVLCCSLSYAAVPVFQDSFESGDLSKIQNGWSWVRKPSSNEPNYIGSKASGQPVYSGQYSMHIGMQPKAPGADNYNFVDFKVPGNNIKEIWFEYMMYIPPNYYHRDDVSSDNNKFIQLWSGVRGGGGNQYLHWVPSTWLTKNGQPGESRITTAFLYLDPQGSTVHAPNVALSNDPFPGFADRGKWKKIQWHVKLGDLGQSNGAMEGWIDGVLVASRNNLAKYHAGTLANNHFDGGRFLGWANSGFAELTEFYFDDVKFYTTNPGWGSSSPTCTPTTEVCDGKDNDCDNQVDEGLNCGSPQCTVNSDCKNPPVCVTTPCNWIPYCNQGACQYLPDNSGGDPGDTNNDKRVDIFDLSLVAQNIGKLNFDPRSNLNADTRVDLFDLIEVAKNFGKNYASQQTAICGQNGCESNLGESCNTCSQDCGTCPSSGKFGPGPNAPTGMIQILNFDGTSKDLQPAPPGGYGGAWGDPKQPYQAIQTNPNLPGYNKVHIVPDSGTPSGSAIEFVYEQGKREGFAGAAFYQSHWPGSLQRPRDLYLRLMYKRDPQWTTHASGIDKILYIGYSHAQQPDAIQYVLSYNKGLFGIFSNAKSITPASWRATTPGQIQNGRWYDIEILFVGQSAPGVADGGMRMWVDGVEVTSWQQGDGRQPRPGGPNTMDWALVDTSASHIDWSGMQLGAWYGGAPSLASAKPKNEWLRFGGLHVSGKP